MFSRLVTGRFGHTASGDRGYAAPVSRPGWIARTLSALFGRKLKG